jgi:hypothetical protein
MTIRNLDDVAAQVETLRYCKEQRAALKELEAMARPVVDEAMGDADIGTVNGQPVIKMSRYKASRLNQKALKEAHPELVAEFTELNPVTRMDIDPEEP